MPPTDVVSAVRAELEQCADEKTRKGNARFFRETVKCRGVKMPVVWKTARKFHAQIRDATKYELFSMCESLLESDYCEDAFIAFEWAYLARDSYDPSDFKMFERWVGKYVNNWAKCDTLCNHALGSFIEQHPRYIPKIKAWTKSDNRWFRRASAVTLILPARRGKFLKDAFDISTRLLNDDDDLVQKGYGWLLKEASRTHRKEVFEYVMKNKKRMPRTALRYSIEKLPNAMREKAMQV